MSVITTITLSEYVMIGSTGKQPSHHPWLGAVIHFTNSPPTHHNLFATTLIFYDSTTGIYVEKVHVQCGTLPYQDQITHPISA